MGHNFGMSHSSMVECGEFPNRIPLGGNCEYNSLLEYGDFFDIMSKSDSKSNFNIRNKEIALGWIDDQNILETVGGTFLISDLNEDTSNTAKLSGLKVPIYWGSEAVILPKYPFHLVANESFGGAGATNYYLEYVETIDKEYLFGVYSQCSEDTYGINLTSPEGGLLLRLGRDNMDWYTQTWLINTHPNAQICCGNNPCKTDSYYSNRFAFILEGETYYDELNEMNITFIEQTPEGAIVRVVTQYTLEGDINGDGLLNIDDYSAFANDFYGDYNPRSDLNIDGVVNLIDVGQFAGLFYGGGFDTDSICYLVCNGNNKNMKEIGICECSSLPNPGSKLPNIKF